MSVLQLYVRNPAKNRYVNKEKFGTFRRERVPQGEAASVGAVGLQGSQEWQ